MTGSPFIFIFYYFITHACKHSSTHKCTPQKWEKSTGPSSSSLNKEENNNVGKRGRGNPRNN